MAVDSDGKNNGTDGSGSTPHRHPGARATLGGARLVSTSQGGERRTMPCSSIGPRRVDRYIRRHHRLGVRAASCAATRFRSTVCGARCLSGKWESLRPCLTLAMLAEARTRYTTGVACRVDRRRVRYDRIERRARPAAVARDVLGSDATIVHGDARATDVGPCRAVLFFDVLHMLQASEQEALLATVSAALERGGVVLIREADASGGWRFAAVRLGNRVKALAFGHWRQKFHFRTTDEWLACFAAHELAGQVRPMRAGTPFANVLFRVPVPATRMPPPAYLHQLLSSGIPTRRRRTTPTRDWYVPSACSPRGRIGLAPPRPYQSASRIGDRPQHCDRIGDGTTRRTRLVHSRNCAPCRARRVADEGGPATLAQSRRSEADRPRSATSSTIRAATYTTILLPRHRASTTASARTERAESGDDPAPARLSRQDAATKYMTASAVHEGDAATADDRAP